MTKRRTFIPEFKFEAVLDIVRREKTVAQICRIGTSPNRCYTNGAMPSFERALGIFADQYNSVNGSDPQDEHIAELERFVEHQTPEIEVLKRQAAC